MWRPTRWGGWAFAAFVVLAAAGALVGPDRSASIGAAFGVAGGVGGALAVAAGMRSELGDGVTPVTLRRVLPTAVAVIGPVWLALCGLYVAIDAWEIVGRRAGVVAAVVAGLCLVAMLGGSARASVRIEGVDREVLLRSATFSFFATVLAAGAYGLFEGLADAPKLSMWTVWTFGMLTWASSTIVVKRRLS